MTAGAAACDLFPTSRDVADLAEPFRTGVAGFLDELAAKGCTVEIHATRRPEQRAWLMRGAWDVARWGLAYAPEPRPDIPITWTRAGAQQMVARYELVHRPALDSLHILGEAVDMTITGWKGELEDLYALGERHGVRKLRTDPPHWSSTGR